MTWGTNAGPLQVTTVPTFKIVVVVLESDGRQAAPSLHAIPWGIKALAPSQQLQMLKLPSSLCSLLWRTVVLSQALCGCELQDLRPKQLVPLASGGKAIMGPKFCHSNERLAGPGADAPPPPLGDSRCRIPCWCCGSVGSSGTADGQITLA